MTKHESDAIQAGDRPAQEIEITPAMIKAGVWEMREKVFGQSLTDIVRDVYLAMELERRG